MYFLFVFVFALLLIINGSSVAQEFAQKVEQEANSDYQVDRMIKLTQALTLVERVHLEECVSRTICELACNPDKHGSIGTKMGNTLRQFEEFDLPQVKYYKRAEKNGLVVKPNCKKCSTFYSKCKTPTRTIIMMAEAIHLFD